MKNKFYLIGLLFYVGCATTLPPAGPTKTMIDGSDKIYLIVDGNPDEAYKSFANYLSGEGFGFDNSDETIRILKTDKKESSSSASYQFYINASIRSDSSTTIQISGNGTNSYLGDFEIRNRGAKGSILQESWKELVNIAEGYSHDEIYFSRN